MTEACRIHGEPHTMFPYTCPLSHFLRAKLVSKGLQLLYPAAGATHDVRVREYSFLSNPRTPEEVKVRAWEWRARGRGGQGG